MAIRSISASAAPCPRHSRRKLIRQSDCIVAFGASLNEMTTARGSYLDGKAVIQCDADTRRIGTWSSVTEAVVGDARMSAEAMLSWLDELGYKAPTGWSANVAAQLRDASNRGVCAIRAMMTQSTRYRSRGD